MAAWGDESDTFDSQALASGRKAPAGFSAASSGSKHKRDQTSDHAAPGRDDGSLATSAPELPIECRPHSFDQICVKDYKGREGPWFVSAVCAVKK
mmetsp:Transcript_33563/g.53976  ORF Transcript_33563/g.53976 Transcript_33563/m.53976 type:complete len:95 (+) Transcript_33563:43-327(+)